MKIKYKKLIISILIPLVLGALVGFLSGSGKSYQEMVMPSFAPPKILFPIVWSILYILMGVSSYLIKNCNNIKKNDAISIYRLQLGVNLLWSFIFFSFKWYFFAFLWILLLIGLVILMIKKFYYINKISAYLQIPYLIWIIFAAILNFAIFILN